jgi:hypothetical protein
MTVFKTGQHTRASAGSLALAADFIASFLLDQSVRSDRVPEGGNRRLKRPRSCEKTRRANRACRRELPRGTGSLEETARQDRRDASTKPPTDFSYFAGARNCRHNEHRSDFKPAILLRSFFASIKIYGVPISARLRQKKSMAPAGRIPPFWATTAGS